MSETEYVGLDWGGSGWIGVILVGEVDPAIDVAFYPSILNAWRDNRDAARLLVDIPIGLADDTRRECDKRARELLADDRSRVFFTPVRDAVYEDEYETAADVNEAATGHRISTQAYHICPRIRVVDAVLREIDAARETVREAHPELCYAALDGGAGLPPKTTEDGIERRRKLLATALERSVDDVRAAETAAIDDRPIHARRLGASNRDDLLDAFVLAVTARGETVSLPRSPPTDRHGLPMEIVAPASVTALR